MGRDMGLVCPRWLKHPCTDLHEPELQAKLTLLLIPVQSSIRLKLTPKRLKLRLGRIRIRLRW